MNSKVVLFYCETYPSLISVNKIIQNCTDSVICVVRLPFYQPKIKQSLIQKIRYFARIAPQVLLYKIYESGIYPIVYRIFYQKRFRSTLEKKNIRFIDAINFSSAQLLKTLMPLNPQYIFNFSSAYLDNSILNIAKKGTINFHGAKLPNHKGVANYFWCLIDGAKTWNVSSHFMTHEYDSGGIVKIREFNIAPEDSVHQVNRKTAIAGFELALDLIRDISEGKSLLAAIAPSGKSEYRGFPNCKRLRELRRRRRKILTLQDIYSDIISLKSFH